MIYDVAIRLETPMLGDQMNQNRVRVFRRGTSGMTLEVETYSWFEAFEEAAAVVSNKFDASLLRVPDEIQLPSVHFYVRKYWAKGTRRKAAHECIRPGTVLRFQLVYVGKTDESEMLRKILEFVGDRLGLSPWGSGHKYGRFHVIEIKAAQDAPASGRGEPGGDRVDEKGGKGPHVLGKTLATRSPLEEKLALLESRIVQENGAGGGETDDSVPPGFVAKGENGG